jgi:hypothetical protein
MKHASTRMVAAHWNKIRGGRRLPDRADIDPGAIKAALRDTFILSDKPRSKLSFRLAGTGVCSLFGHELKATAFRDLWDAPNRALVEVLAGTVADECVGIIGGGVGWTAEGFSLELEWMLLPLRQQDGNQIRLLGTIAPLAVPYWLGNSPVTTVALNGYRYIGAPLDDAAAAGAEFAARWRNGLRVYEGGRA